MECALGRTILALIGFASFAIAGQPLDDLSKCLSNLTQINSLAFTAISGRADISTIRNSQWKLSAEGLYYIDVYEERGLAKLPPWHSIWGFDGERLFCWNQNIDQLTLSATKLKYDPNKAIKKELNLLLPYQFLREESDPFVSLSDLQKPDFLSNLAKRFKMLGTVTKEGKTLVQAEVSGCFDPDLKIPCTITVDFDSSQGWLPVFWEARDNDGEAFKRVKIDEVKKLEVSENQTFFYPSKITIFRNRFGGTMTGPKPFPWQEKQIAISEVQVNSLDQSDFSIDPTISKTILDQDSNTYITVPK